MSLARDIADLAVTTRLDTVGGSSGALSNRNVLVNSAMQVAQRGTSSTGLGATTGYYTADRWEHQFNATAGRLTSSVVGITDLAGFRSALKFACTTADTSIASGEYFCPCSENRKDLSIQRFGFGTASAKPLTLSFFMQKVMVTHSILLSYKQEEVTKSLLLLM